MLCSILLFCFFYVWVRSYHELPWFWHWVEFQNATRDSINIIIIKKSIKFGWTIPLKYSWQYDWYLQRWVIYSGVISFKRKKGYEQRNNSLTYADNSNAKPKHKIHVSVLSRIVSGASQGSNAQKDICMASAIVRSKTASCSNQQKNRQPRVYRFIVFPAACIRTSWMSWNAVRPTAKAITTMFCQLASNQTVVARPWALIGRFIKLTDKHRGA